MIAVAKQKWKIRSAQLAKKLQLLIYVVRTCLIKKNFLILLLAVIFSSLVSWLKTNTADIGTVKLNPRYTVDQKACPFFVHRSSSSKRRFLWPYFTARIPNFVLVSFTVRPFTTISLRTNITREQNRQLTCHNTVIPRLKSIFPLKQYTCIYSN